jgi:hypothetical protein
MAALWAIAGIRWKGIDMNDQLFDRLTKVVGSAATRRRVLTGVLAVPLALGWSHRSEAKVKAKLKQCKLPSDGASALICQNQESGAAYFGVCSAEDIENGFAQAFCLSKIGSNVECVKDECVLCVP